MKIKSLKAIIIGSGSIGKKHFQILNKLNVQTKLISSRDFHSKKIKLDFEKFDLTKTIFLICNNSSLHFKTLKKIARKKMNIFIEKPIISDDQDLKKIQKIIKKFKLNIFTGYLFRHDPRIIQLKKIVNKNIKKNIISFLYLTNLYASLAPKGKLQK